ncbi:MAG: polyprenyl synthetase family protein [Bacteroidales bacterium]|nr:polyprenyl synthetase family protein [Bacteroidales bacterium]
MHTVEQYIDIINKALENITYPAEPSGLYAPVKYQLDMGGKRVRPLLALMACDMFGGNINNVISPALGLEIFHNFTLLHDDVMDNADIRRGRATVHKAWSENTAILSGDAMQIIATQKIAETPVDVLKEVLDLYNTTALEICEGQQYDMEFEERDDVSVEEYIEMIRLKTAVLIGCALKTGAIVAHATPAQADAIYKFGVNIGLAFQLQDDYLDVYGDPAKFGKKIGGDILNNKKTYMLISALTFAKGKEKERLQTLISGEIDSSDAKIAEVTSIYTSLGIDKMAKDKIEEYSLKALQYLEDIPNSDELKKFAHSLTTRQL